MRSLLRRSLTQLAIIMLFTVCLSAQTNNSILKTNDLTDGLVAYYPFSGSTKDESGNGYDATNYGAVLTTDRFGTGNSAYYFNGETNWIEAGLNVKEPTGTISLWFKAEELENSMLFCQIHHPYSAATLNYKLSNNGNDEGFLDIRSDENINAGISTKRVTSLNEWHHLVCIWGEEGSRLYLDNELQGKTDLTYYDNSSTINMGIGCYNGHHPRAHYFHGTIDEFRIYNRALSYSEIQELYYENGWKGYSNIQVFDIPDQTIFLVENQGFDEIELNKYIFDEKYNFSDIEWQINGSNLLKTEIIGEQDNRKIKITNPNNAIGTFKYTVKAINPSGLSSEDEINLTIKNLPEYIAVESDWLDTYQKRINQIRRGDLTFKILDEENSPIENAYVKIKLLRHEFDWGSAIDNYYRKLNTDEYNWLKKEFLQLFNKAVFENEFKWFAMEPQNGTMNFENVDADLAWAEINDINYRGHTLIWGGWRDDQNPIWTHPEIKDGVKDTTVNRLTKAELVNACSTRVAETISNYKTRINEFDVINEPIHEKYLSSYIGESINWNAYKWAKEANKNSKLYVNDFNILMGGSAEVYKKTIQQLLSNGAPIDGIGIQGHLGSTLNWQVIRANIDLLSELGLPIKITEFDMESESLDENTQAFYYDLMMRLAFSHKNINGFIFWGFYDKIHWKKNAGLIDKNKNYKESYKVVDYLIHDLWTTNSSNVTDQSGIVTFDSSYFGKYLVEVETASGDSESFTLDYFADQKDNTITLRTNFRNILMSEGETNSLDDIQNSGTFIKTTANENNTELQLEIFKETPEGALPITEQSIKGINDYINIEITSGSVEWPIFIKLFFTQKDLDDAGLDKQDLKGIYFWDEAQNQWILYSESGDNSTTSVVTDTITIADKKYEGYLWANAYHLTKMRGGSIDTTLISIQNSQEIPFSFYIKQNYPNPFNPNTSINFGLPSNSNVKIDIYNAIGQKVKTVLNKKMFAGHHSITFDGSALSSGLYFYKITAGNFVQVKKMLLMK